jgi:hypothetical protein
LIFVVAVALCFATPRAGQNLSGDSDSDSDSQIKSKTQDQKRFWRIYSKDAQPAVKEGRKKEGRAERMKRAKAGAGGEVRKITMPTKGRHVGRKREKNKTKKEEQNKGRKKKKKSMKGCRKNKNGTQENIRHEGHTTKRTEG